jgi:bifunctional non-homologous end joining protein LigD
MIKNYPKKTKKMKIQCGRYDIEITHPERIVFGKSGLTKKDLIDYYLNIAPTMLPYLNDRPISMQRFPDGIEGEGFFQKNANDYFPNWITKKPIAKENGDSINYVVIDKQATLIYLANQNCITPHLWLSKVDNLNKPDRMIFDLDPADKLPFSIVQQVAKKLKEILDTLDLPSFYLLTGSRGAHIIVPLKRIHTFDEVRDFAHEVSLFLARKFPTLITVEMSKAKRGKRVFMDWLRNAYGATAVAPYAVRARENAPVAMPITWKELQKKGISSQKYTITNAMKRITIIGDLWHDMHKYAVSLKNARKKLELIKKDSS